MALKHPNIVSILGCIESDFEVGPVVMQVLGECCFLPAVVLGTRASLKHWHSFILFAEVADAGDLAGYYKKEKIIPWKDCFDFAVQLAKGKHSATFIMYRNSVLL
jgi:hypothetical protein